MSDHYRPRREYDYDDGYRRPDDHRNTQPPSQINGTYGTVPDPFYPPQNAPQSQPPPQSALRYRPPIDTNRYQVHDQESVAKNTIVEIPVQKSSRHVPVLRLVLDLVLVTLAWIPVILLNTINKPFERGFYCDDESIRYPLKNDTITPLALYTVGAAIVIVTVIIVECAVTFTKQNNGQMVYAVRGKPVHPLLSSLYIYLGYCAIGFIMVQIATDICKNMVGRLRPHFIDACNPDWSQINCSGFQYVTKAFCQNENAKVVKEARVSFLSGHSSYSAYMMFYLVFYLQARWRWPGCSLLAKHFLQFAFVMLSLFTGLSRISDYKHHWSDVMCGYALGTLVACLTALHIGKFFKREANITTMAVTGHLEQGYPIYGERHTPEHMKPMY